VFLHYLGTNELSNCTCSTTDTGFISTKLFPLSSSILTLFCRNIPEENVKNTCCSLASYLYFRVPYTNHATDAIKTVVHMVNMKFRKIKKNNVRNTNKTSQLKQEVLKLSSMRIHASVQRLDRVGLHKKFCGNKTSTGS